METQATSVHFVMRFQSAQNAELTNVLFVVEFVAGVATNVVITKQNVWRDTSSPSI